MWADNQSLKTESLQVKWSCAHAHSKQAYFPLYLSAPPSVIAHTYTHILHLTAAMNKPDAHVWTWLDLKATQRDESSERYRTIMQAFRKMQNIHLRAQIHTPSSQASSGEQEAVEIQKVQY